MTIYLFQNASKSSIKNYKCGDNKHIYVSNDLLNKISVRWSEASLCDNIKNKSTLNLFNDRISNIMPMILDNAKLLENGDIVTINNIIYRTTMHENDNNINNAQCNRYDNVICLSGKWSDEIFHFPFEFLCKLRTVDYDGKYIHIKKNAYTKQWMDLCNIDEKYIVYGNVYARKLYVPHFPPCGNPDVSDILWLRDIVFSNLDNTKESTRLILVKRNKSRCIINYNELEKYATDYAVKMKLDFVIHDDNNLCGLREQLQYFSEAKIIITPHGGSEINLLACKKNTHVIELMDMEYTNLCFTRIAYFLNLKYYAIETFNFEISMNKLNDLLSSILL